MREPGDGRRPVTVWDLPTRLFHWTLAAVLVGSYLTGEDGPIEVHSLLGYGVLALLLFRLAWGFAGSETARFAAFVRAPGAAFAHLRALMAPGPLHADAGHNPLGAYAVLALLGLVAVQVVTGLFLTDDETFWAPLNGYASEETIKLLEEIHEVNVNLLIALVAVHVAAVLWYALAKRLDLVRPMVTGRALLPAGARAPALASPLRALALALAAAGAVWALVTYA